MKPLTYIFKVLDTSLRYRNHSTVHTARCKILQLKSKMQSMNSTNFFLHFIVSINYRSYSHSCHSIDQTHSWRSFKNVLLSSLERYAYCFCSRCYTKCYIYIALRLFIKYTQVAMFTYWFLTRTVTLSLIASS